MHKTFRLRTADLVFAAFFTAFGAHATSASTSPIEEGNRLWAEGKLEAAQSKFEEAVKANPKSVEAQMKLAGMQITRQNFTAAIYTYRNALAIDPNNAKAWMGMGMCYLHTGAREMARAAFEEALRVDPKRKQQIDPILAELDSKIEAKRAQIAAAMPDDSNHKGKPALPTSKPASMSGQPAKP
jgi:Tfp pilus assembly protein PilF